MMSEENKKKLAERMRERMTGKPSFWKGKKRPAHSQESHDRQAEKLKGRKLSPEHCVNISKGLKGSRHQAYHFPKGYKPWNYKGVIRDKAWAQARAHSRKLRMTEGGELKRETIQIIYEDNIKRHGKLTCYLCLKPIEFGKDCIEHKMPISRGGKNLYENIDIAHISCNASKGCKNEKEYRDWLLKRSLK